MGDNACGWSPEAKIASIADLQMTWSEASWNLTGRILGRNHDITIELALAWRTVIIRNPNINHGLYFASLACSLGFTQRSRPGGINCVWHVQWPGAPTAHDLAKGICWVWTPRLHGLKEVRWRVLLACLGCLYAANNQLRSKRARWRVPVEVNEVLLLHRFLELCRG